MSAIDVVSVCADEGDTWAVYVDGVLATGQEDTVFAGDVPIGLVMHRRLDVVRHFPVDDGDVASAFDEWPERLSVLVALQRAVFGKEFGAELEEGKAS